MRLGLAQLEAPAMTDCGECAALRAALKKVLGLTGADQWGEEIDRIATAALEPPVEFSAEDWALARGQFPEAQTRQPEPPSRWGARFEGVRCVRHGQATCPSCLVDALGDAMGEAEAASARANALQAELTDAEQAGADWRDERDDAREERDALKARLGEQ